MEFIQQILSICGAVSIVGGAGAVIIKVIRPAFKLSKKVIYPAWGRKDSRKKLRDRQLVRKA